MRKVPLKLREFVGNAIRLKIQTSLDGQGASDPTQTSKNKRSQEGGKRPNNNETQQTLSAPPQVPGPKIICGPTLN